MPRHSYDLTNDNWIDPPSGVKPDAGRAAELREQAEHTSVLRFRPSARPPSVPPSWAAGTFQQRIFDGLLTIAALAMFGCIAFFFLVLT